MLIKVAQIVTAAHRDMYSCTRWLTNEPWLHNKKGHHDLLHWVFTSSSKKYMLSYLSARYWPTVTKFVPQVHLTWYTK